jgi:hypothetical protein
VCPLSSISLSAKRRPERRRVAVSLAKPKLSAILSAVLNPMPLISWISW